MWVAGSLGGEGGMTKFFQGFFASCLRNRHQQLYPAVKEYFPVPWIEVSVTVSWAIRAPCSHKKLMLILPIFFYILGSKQSQP